MKKFLAVIASLTLLAFAVPAMAQEATAEQRLAALEGSFQSSMKFYGSVRMETFWYKLDEQVTGDPAGFGSRTDYNQRLQANARIGGRVSAGDVRGHFEYGHNDRGFGNNTTLRILTGEWNFGAGSILVGQTETPTSFFTSHQAARSDRMQLGWGARYIGRAPMIQLTMGDFKFAAIRNLGNVANLQGVPWTGQETQVPQLQASYTLRVNGLTANLAGAWQTYKAYDRTAAVKRTESVDSHLLALGAVYSMGPFGFFGDAYFGQNVRDIGHSVIPDGMGLGYDRPVWANNAVQDSDTYGWLLGARFRVNDMLSLEAGYGERKDKIDFDAFNNWQKVKTYYLQAPITLAKGVWVIPEAGVFDYGDNNVAGVAPADLGKTKYLGAKWQINF